MHCTGTREAEGARGLYLSRKLKQNLKKKENIQKFMDKLHYKFMGEEEEGRRGPPRWVALGPGNHVRAPGCQYNFRQWGAMPPPLSAAMDTYTIRFNLEYHIMLVVNIFLHKYVILLFINITAITKILVELKKYCANPKPED